VEKVELLPMVRRACRMARLFRVSPIDQSQQTRLVADGAHRLEDFPMMLLRGEMTAVQNQD
jgi:hypothetical protein